MKHARVFKRRHDGKWRVVFFLPYGNGTGLRAFRTHADALDYALRGVGLAPEEER